MGEQVLLSWELINVQRGSIVVFDRGFPDYSWYEMLTKKGIYFVTRLKHNAVIEKGQKRRGRKASGITIDRTIHLCKVKTEFRQVNYLDPEIGKEIRFVTNADHLEAKTIADVYKKRWQIELFFK